jgi:NADH:flavin oxidoreductase / NADH oxidase family
MSSIDPFAPALVGPLTLRNRFIKAATFEGMAEKNLVSDRLIEFHRVMAAGGVGMTTVAYLAVSEDGQGAPGELSSDPTPLPVFAGSPTPYIAKGRRSRPRSAMPTRFPPERDGPALHRRKSSARWL